VTPTKTPTAPPTQNNSPAIVTFDVTPTDVDCSVNPLPTTVHAEWSVKNATGVTISIDGGGAYKAYDGTTGSDDVAWSCGSAQHEYKLATTGGSGTAAQQTLTVKRAVPIIDEFFGPTIVAPGPCDKIWHVSLHYTVFNATGATIETNGQILGNYTGKSNDVPVDFDCRNNNISQLYKLTTIDNYGPPATLETYITYDGS
jgi:hypothetical protein